MTSKQLAIPCRARIERAVGPWSKFDTRARRCRPASSRSNGEALEGQLGLRREVRHVRLRQRRRGVLVRALGREARQRAAEALPQQNMR